MRLRSRVVRFLRMRKMQGVRKLSIPLRFTQSVWTSLEWVLSVANLIKPQRSLFRTWHEITPYYDPRVVNYDHKLATGLVFIVQPQSCSRYKRGYKICYFYFFFFFAICLKIMAHWEAAKRIVIRVTRLDHFWKALSTNFLTKIAKKFGHFWAILKNVNL